MNKEITIIQMEEVLKDLIAFSKPKDGDSVSIRLQYKTVINVYCMRMNSRELQELLAGMLQKICEDRFSDIFGEPEPPHPFPCKTKGCQFHTKTEGTLCFSCVEEEIRRNYD